MLPKVTIFLAFLLCTVNLCISDIDIQEIAKKIAQDVNTLKNEELGVPFIDKLYGSFKYTLNENGIKTDLHLMSQKLLNKINNVFYSMENASNILNTLPSIGSSSVFLPCIKEEANVLDVLVNNYLVGNNSIRDSFGSKYVLYQIGKNITLLPNAVRQQYFMLNNEFKETKHSPFLECSGHEESVVWKNFRMQSKYMTKNVILIVDHGASLSKRQLHIAKAIAKEMLLALNKDDRVALIGLASEWSFPETYCTQGNNATNVKLEHATAAHVTSMINFIDSLDRGNGSTNHTSGIQVALDIALKNTNLDNETIMIAYISRGLLSSLREARTVLKTVAQYTDNIKTAIVIHTCAVIDEMKPILYETHFLRDIAYQNFTKYNITFNHNVYRKMGYMLTVNKTDEIGFVVSKFYSTFNPSYFFDMKKQITLPHWDPQSSDLTVSFLLSWNYDGFAMLGTDIYFSNIVEDVAYYSSNQRYTYAFLIDLEGHVLVHPFISTPSPLTHQITFTNLRDVEKIPDIDVLMQKLVTEMTGNHVTRNQEDEVLEYSWSRVGYWYVICIVLNENYGEFNRPFKASPSPSVRKLLYQNLDGIEEYKLCKHLNQVATLDVASLYLSRSCFQSPFSASRTTQDKLIVQGYLAYLKDDTGLLINPGLKKEVRDEVLGLAHVLDFLRKKHLSSELSKYIVRRYASSYKGVLQMFPGSVLLPDLEITKRPWFLRALQNKDKVILIPPYLDQGGAGYIVTLAYATPQAVIAMDLTYGFMLKMLLKHLPFCLNQITCFLIDDQGYIIYHPKLMDIKGARPVEQQHIVHRESLVANDILNHKHFIKKMLCNNYGDNTVQRYYRLNTSFSNVLVNFVPGEHCVTYRITPVPNTNIFVGIVNASCDVVATFCPCSIVDRLCLNCNRMEQKECECPCECPLEKQAANSCQDISQNLTNNLPCSWHTESSFVDATFAPEVDDNLDVCFPVNCQSERSHLECLGVIGCEWCKYDSDGSYLKNPFCSRLSNCFNGVYGLRTPYRENINESVLPTENEYSPLGPILGLVIAMCVFFVLLYICYRSYSNPAVDRLYLSSTQDQLRMSDLNINENFHDLGNHRDKLLQDEGHDPISPYCVASNYRRNNTAADSDHGYSTMTPHDESEHLSLAPIEVDSLEDDIMSDTTSVHTSVSTKNAAQNVISPMFTKIPHRNCMVVPVTVHRHMETT
ncbi:VWFA and cache domain-containing protein 1 [Cylas formicarius]|uniref:VWFA and cache domain-containing protein 1 n=1 Tax=Cylas formicarius TaxID=197179 RepID=UPI002958C9CF|nr:VWFA and cache domain-containing protein 1 [Cylas formicarius]